MGLPNLPKQTADSTAFDNSVTAVRLAGVPPKCTCRRKADCTPEQWAAHRAYMAARYQDPRCRAMHRANQIKYLAKR
jgi:hypothetical protein